MFDITFYHFSKKYNSTKRPGPDLPGETFACEVLEGTAIYNPRIILDIGLERTPARYNYCVIPSFDNRFYWIREWSFDRGLWCANLQEDYLASWRNTIGANYFYILRAANEYNGDIMDGLYPVKSGCSFSRQTAASPYNSINEGCFIIGVVSKGGNFGSLTYHALTAASMAALCTALIDPSLINSSNGFNINDASQALQLSLIEPLSYIKSAVWLPFSIDTIPGTDIPASGSTGGFDIFNFHLTGFTHKIITNTAPYINIAKTFTITKHPDTNSRGNYVNSAPYTIATLSFPPFGVIELDTSVLCNASNISVNLITDVINGRGTLVIKANNIILNRIESQIGVPIQLSQVTRDYIGAVNNALGAIGSIAGTVGSIAAGSAAGAVSGIASSLSGIINAGVSLTPRPNTIGSGGGFSHLQGDFELDFQFFRPVTDDPRENGRPLCEVRRPDTIGGYMLIQDADIEMAATFEEATNITSLLESGFYFE